MASNRKTFRLNNMTGGINSIAEENALLSFDYNGQGVQAEARDIENFLPLNRGGQSNRMGFSVTYSNGGTPITGLYRFLQANGTSFFLQSSGADVYKMDAWVPTSIYTGISPGAYVDFQTALDKCIICDGVGAPQAFDGATTAAVAAGADGTAILGSRQSLFYGNRLWLFGNTSNPSLLYYSNPGVINAGYSSNFINCDANDGQKITAIAKYFVPNLLEPVIVVGKERSVGLITGDGSTANPYTFSKLNQDAGIAGFRQIVQFGSDAAYLTRKGVSTLKTDKENLNLVYLYLSEKVRNQFTALNQTALDKALSWYDWKNTRVSFAVPESANTTPNVIWHFDTRLGCWYKERWGGSFDCTAALVDTDGTVYHADSNGAIYQHDLSQSFNTNAINAYYTTAYLDFGAPNLYKRILAARMLLRGDGEYTIGVSSKLDWGIRQNNSNNLNVTQSAYLWNGGVWTDDSNVYQWGTAPLALRKFFPTGYFRAIQFTISASGTEQPLDMFELEFDVEFGSLV